MTSPQLSEGRHGGWKQSKVETLLRDIAKTLKKTTGDSSLTLKSLADLLEGFVNFQEIWLGRNTKKPRTATKLPSHLFSDYSVTGAVRIILETIINFRNQLPQKHIDFGPASQKETNLELFQTVRQALESSGLLESPRIFLGASLSERDRRLLLRVCFFLSFSFFLYYFIIYYLFI